MRRVLAALVLALAATPSVVAQAGAHAGTLSVLEWHPFPDPDAVANLGGDPFGTPFTPGASEDRMLATFNASWFPTTRFDGVLESSYARDGIAEDVRAFHDVYRSRIESRLAEPSPLALTLNASGNRTLVAEVDVRALADVSAPRLGVHLVVFEDGVSYRGGNGVPVHRFLARYAWPVEPLRPLAEGDRAHVTRNVTQSESQTYPQMRWGERLGVVAFVANEDSNEVLQSATFFLGQDGPTVQTERAVLLEMYTATWCPSCVWGDGAVDLLADEYGVAAAVATERSTSYYRAPSLIEAGLGALAAGLLGLALWPRKGGLA